MKAALPLAALLPLLMSAVPGQALPVDPGCEGAVGAGSGTTVVYVYHGAQGPPGTVPIYAESGARPGLQASERGPCFWRNPAERDIPLY